MAAADQVLSDHSPIRHPDTRLVGSSTPKNLGPLLFVIYINDLTRKITCGNILFADDVKIFPSHYVNWKL